ILHRKETFLHRGDPRWEGFAEITAAEEKAGLYADTSTIGYRNQWQMLLKSKGFSL
ncbi:MAG: hypothetical protein RLZ84_698, partial [Actinomycetota bacterium]